MAYLYIYMEAQDFEKAVEAGDKEEYEIDQEHHNVLRETLTGDSPWVEFDTIGHFTNPALR